jgi:hypothetical protein
MTFVPLNNNATHRKDLNLTEPWTAREREEHEALPPTFSIWERPVYQPPRMETPRPGASDHLNIKRRGV